MKKSKSLEISILLSSLLIVGALVYSANARKEVRGKTETVAKTNKTEKIIEDNYEQKVIPENGVVLPAKWGDLGAKMTSVGVIDKIKLEELYASRRGLNGEERKLLEGLDNGYLKITPENSGFVLNLLWALGLGNKNEILDNGPMTDKKYGGAGGFASTGGWTLADGGPARNGAGAMNHYSQHRFIVLTPEQQALAERVAKGIYRPCCGNPAYFPACNHGMAMLGLLELMASQGVSEEEMYKAALAVNSYWFPDTYLTIAKYLKNNGIEWDSIEPKTILGESYSSAQGYARIQSLVAPEPSTQSQGGCGVDTGQVAQPQQQQSGCGVQ